MNYLITGGAGFIGSSIAKRLLADGHQVTCIDNFRTGLKENIPEAATFIELDIRNIDDVRSKLTGKFDAVLHLAGQSSGEVSHDDPEYDADTNAKGTLNMMLWAHEQGIKRFLHASSMGVYGQVTPDQCPVREQDHVDPLSFYGVSKLASEKYANYFISQGMNVTSFRMFNVYGPGQNLANMKQGMVSIFLAFVLNDQPVHVKGSKDRFRDFVHIDDVVDVWVKSIGTEAVYNKSYNLAFGRQVFVHELVDGLVSACGKDSSYPVKYEGQTPGDQMGIYAEVSKLKQDLNWEPKVGLQEGLASLAAAYR